jgi:hypothetical protein
MSVNFFPVGRPSEVPARPTRLHCASVSAACAVWGSESVPIHSSCCRSPFRRPMPITGRHPDIHVSDNDVEYFFRQCEVLLGNHCFLTTGKRLIELPRRWRA